MNSVTAGTDHSPNRIIPLSTVSGDLTLYIAQETEPLGREETAWQEEGRDRNTWVSYPILEQSLLLQQLERH